MKFLLDGSVFESPATGVAKVTVGLYRECLRLEPAMSVHTIHRGPFPTPVPRKLRARRFAQLLPSRFWRTLAIPSSILAYRPSVVHFPWNGNVPVLPPGPFVVSTLHDVLPLTIPSYFSSASLGRQYCKRVQRDIRRSDLIITDSAYSRQEILKYFDVREEPIVIYYGPTVSKNTFTEDDKPAAPYFLYVGGYDPRKGLQRLVSIVLDLHSEGKLNSKLLLTGIKLPLSTEFEEAVETGKKLGVIDELGYVTEEQLTKLYSRARALVYPSRYEGFGLPPLEAMAIGCPVITTRCTSIPEVCGDAALYVDPNDDQTLAQALVQLDASNHLRSLLIARGLRQAERFSWARAAEAYIEAIQRVMRKRGGQSLEYR